ncbi:MAG: VCBS repeat-containing protein, partial [Planctomycetota bacterium]
DVDGDGLSDVLVGGYLSSVGVQAAGVARVYRGLAGTALCSLHGDSKKDHLGLAVGAAGDVDGDGRADLIVGVRFDDPAGILDAGSAMVIAGQGIVGVTYCGPAVPNSTLLPGLITAFGSELVADQDVTLKATQLPPNKFGAFLVAGAAGFFPNLSNSQGTLCLSGTIGRYFKLVKKASPAGIVSIQVDLTALPFSPNVTVLPGDTWYFQCWYRDLNPGNTSNFTDGVAITFQ